MERLVVPRYSSTLDMLRVGSRDSRCMTSSDHHAIASAMHTAAPSSPSRTANLVRIGIVDYCAGSKSQAQSCSESGALEESTRPSTKATFIAPAWRLPGNQYWSPVKINWLASVGAE